MKTNVTGLILLTLLVTFSVFVHSEDEAVGVTVFGGVGKTFLDNSRLLNDENHWVADVGHRFSGAYAIELQYQNVDTKSGGVGRDVDFIHLDGLYHFSTDSILKPYFFSGLGQSTVQVFFTLGGGVKYLFNPRSAFRADHT
jgi:hypothetical protein